MSVLETYIANADVLAFRISGKPVETTAAMENTANADEFWTVRCAPGDAVCDENASFVLLVSGSYDVTIRFEDAAKK
ncbi:hypothetical protein P3T76_009106 [Phytophthora citrophthora]|uniref:Uncharacterized protein n=1 Tax=Phytophthora citrophthora TaxID=4793 RepID=A0AAD9GJ46_9STRA|nr:hypothetical protein P3T76_009106 [Phytophthora citrophthora]